MNRITAITAVDMWKRPVGKLLLNTLMAERRQEVNREGDLVKTRVVDDVGDAGSIPDMGSGFYLSVLARRKFTEPHVLNFGVNIHPAPPEYPGVGVATRALLDGAKTFGVTVHRISAELDKGKILHVERFDIPEGVSCDELYAMAEQKAVALVPFVVEKMATYGVDWPDAPDVKWGEYVGRAAFDRMLGVELDYEFDDRDVSVRIVDRLVKAARHPDKPGPYVRIGQHKFAYCHE